MKNLFQKQDVTEVITRINNLTPATKGQWGKMNVAQMLAHCNVAYEMAYDRDKHPPATGLKRFMMKLFIKKPVVGPKPYPKNSRTAPAFLIVDEKEFEKEKKRLIDNIRKTQDLGAKYFHNRLSASFGPLTEEEWNVLFAKHLNHHLTQFGV